MAIANVKATFPCEVQKVWDIVTSLDNYAWRSDVKSIYVLSDEIFVEYSNDDFATVFTITVSEPCKRWEFEILNNNIKGYWTGIFSEENGMTTIDFTEKATSSSLFMKPFVKKFLEKQQAQYIADLQKACLNLT